MKAKERGACVFVGLLGGGNGGRERLRGEFQKSGGVPACCPPLAYAEDAAYNTVHTSPQDPKLQWCLSGHLMKWENG